VRHTLLSRLAALRGNSAGAVVIETAFIAPILITLSLGGYETSRIISRQAELQSGASEVEAIVQAGNKGTATDTAAIKEIMKSSLGLADSRVNVAFRYRCNAQTTVSTTPSCGSGQVVSTYVRIALTDTYTPVWTKWGIGAPLSFSVTRMVQVA
jgi:Flp pilus assembly protein TadG